MNILKADLNNATHAAALLELLNIYAQDEMGGGQPLSDYANDNLITELNKRPDALIILAFDNELPVGLINCFEGFSTFQCKPLINIHDVIVRAEYRGQGIARQMIDKVEDYARAKGCCKLTLEVLQGNKAAQAAYTKAGFKGYELDPSKGQAMFWEKKL